MPPFVLESVKHCVTMKLQTLRRPSAGICLVFTVCCFCTYMDFAAKLSQLVSVLAHVSI